MTDHVTGGEAWPPIKKAMWDVLIAENLNDGHYIRAFDLVDKLFAAVELVFPAQQTQWQPIETAPRDGTLVLVWPYWGNGKPAAVNWRDLKRGPGRWEISSSFYCFGAQPTHWMPLPEGPTLPSTPSGTEPSAPASEDRTDGR